MLSSNKIRYILLISDSSTYDKNWLWNIFSSLFTSAFAIEALSSNYIKVLFGNLWKVSLIDHKIKEYLSKKSK